MLMSTTDVVEQNDVTVSSAIDDNLFGELWKYFGWFGRLPDGSIISNIAQTIHSFVGCNNYNTSISVVNDSVWTKIFKYKCCCISNDGILYLYHTFGNLKQQQSARKVLDNGLSRIPLMTSLLQKATNNSIYSQNIKLNKFHASHIISDIAVLTINKSVNKSIKMQSLPNIKSIIDLTEWNKMSLKQSLKYKKYQWSTYELHAGYDSVTELDENGNEITGGAWDIIRKIKTYNIEKTTFIIYYFGMDLFCIHNMNPTKPSQCIEIPATNLKDKHKLPIQMIWRQNNFVYFMRSNGDGINVLYQLQFVSDFVKNNFPKATKYNFNGNNIFKMRVLFEFNEHFGNNCYYNIKSKSLFVAYNNGDSNSVELKIISASTKISENHEHMNAKKKSKKVAKIYNIKLPNKTIKSSLNNCKCQKLFFHKPSKCIVLLLLKDNVNKERIFAKLKYNFAQMKFAKICFGRIKINNKHKIIGFDEMNGRVIINRMRKVNIDLSKLKPTEKASKLNKVIKSDNGNRIERQYTMLGLNDTVHKWTLVL